MMIEPRQAFGSVSNSGLIHSITIITIMLAIIDTNCVLPPLASRTTVRARAPQLTKHLKNEPTTFDMPNANNSLLELILYLCFLAYKSATEMLEANATIDIIKASWKTSKNMEISGTAGSGNPSGIFPTIDMLNLLSNFARYVTNVPVIIC